MGRYNSLGWTIALGLVALVLAPLVVLAGEPALRMHRRGWRSRQFAAAVDETMGVSRARGRRVPRTLHYRGGPQRGFDQLLMRFSMHPLVIALTAPARWVRGRFRMNRRMIAIAAPGRWIGDRLHWLLRSPAARRRDQMMRMGGGHERLFPDDPPFLSGVREPRRPKPTPPSDAIALQPPAEHSAHD
jgi:hypothetical protein